MKRIIIILLFPLLYGCNKKENSSGGLTPQQALTTFQLPEGFKIELVAAEPLVTDPVAMEVDENGTMYVVELPGYPLDTTGSGKVKILTDTNGDGAPDKSAVFADHLRMPTGIMRWKKGVIVVDVPDLLYLEDTDNDGKADTKTIMITGVALTNPQHIANTPLYGLDNWIYLAHMGTVTPIVSKEFSDSGSIVRYAGNSAAKTLPRNADGRNIRFKPDSYEMEMLSGESQYGHSFDNWGHHFCVENADHIFHEAIAARYLERNPDLPVASASDYISDHGDACEVYPITINPENQLLTDRGVVTSACGITWYNGGLFPDSFNNVTFVAEPVSNIVHADRINEKGASFTASRIYTKKEFLSSTDGWFRPVQFYIGPDGALYVIDYYRQIVEHPEWLSEEVINSGALYNGADKGRIYRITPSATPKMNWCDAVKLGTAPTNDLVQALGSNNIWWRRTAQRLIMDRKDSSSAILLKAFADTVKSAPALAHALWTLEGLHAINAGILTKALHHEAAGVREIAIQLAELHIADFPELEKELLTLKNDSSAKVRYQLLCTLGFMQNAASETARQELLIHDIEDKWVQIAALSSAKGNEMAMLQKSAAIFSSSPSEGKALFLSNCAEMVALSGRSGDIKKVIQLCTNNNSPGSAWWQAACLKGLTKAISRSGQPDNLDEDYSLLQSKFSESSPPALRSAVVGLLAATRVNESSGWKSLVEKATIAAADSNKDKSYRVDALNLLALDKKEKHNLLLEKIISSDSEAEPLQRTALYAYNKLEPAAACTAIVSHWQNFSNDLRDVAVDIFLSSTSNMNALLDAVKKGTIQTTSINWPAKVHLMNNDDENIRKRARELLASEIGSREMAYKKYEPALTKKGDAAKGLEVFKNVCAICHKYSSAYGQTFGPDLGSISNRDKASIMADILNPNRSIAVKYDLWTVIKTNGEKITGIISAETPVAVTLHQSGKEGITIAKSEIKTMRMSDTSAMPVGLENSITIEQMADLLAFLTNKK